MVFSFSKIIGLPPLREWWFHLHPIPPSWAHLSRSPRRVPLNGSSLGYFSSNSLFSSLSQIDGEWLRLTALRCNRPTFSRGICVLSVINLRGIIPITDLAPVIGVDTVSFTTSSSRCCTSVSILGISHLSFPVSRSSLNRTVLGKGGFYRKAHFLPSAAIFTALFFSSLISLTKRSMFQALLGNLSWQYLNERFQIICFVTFMVSTNLERVAAKAVASNCPSGLYSRASLYSRVRACNENAWVIVSKNLPVQWWCLVPPGWSTSSPYWSPTKKICSTTSETN